MPCGAHFSGYVACSTDANEPAFVGRTTSGVFLEGIPDVTDPVQGYPVTEKFRLWPASDPSQVTTLSYDNAIAGDENGVTVPQGDLTDGAAYAWQAQDLVGGNASVWSAACYFTYDSSSPADPVIASAGYPKDQLDPGGDPVDFTLSAGGANDCTLRLLSASTDASAPNTARPPTPGAEPAPLGHPRNGHLTTTVPAPWSHLLRQ